MDRLPNDPYMLMSCINMQLRDFYPSFSAFCEDTEADGKEILKKLSAAGIVYDEAKNRFS